MKENPYHKINSPFKRDKDVKGFPIIKGDWAIDEFNMLQECQWIAHEKIDGTNIRIRFDGEIVRFGGRTERAQIPTMLLDKLQELFPVDKMKENFSDTNPENPIMLYGEGFGAKIQKGGGNYIPDGVSFILFDVKVGDWWLKDEDVTGVAKGLGIQRAPEVKTGTLNELFEFIEDGFKSTFGDFWAEGIVVKPIHQLFNRGGNRIITKIKHKDFYNKYD